MFQCCSVLYYTSFICVTFSCSVSPIIWLLNLVLGHLFTIIFVFSKESHCHLYTTHVLTTVFLISPLSPIIFILSSSLMSWCMILNLCFCILTHWLHDPAIHGMVVPSQSINHQQFSSHVFDQAAHMYPIR